MSKQSKKNEGSVVSGFSDFLHQVEIHREVVAVTADVIVKIESAERIAFVMPRPLNEVGLVVYKCFVKSVSRLVFICQPFADDDLVEQPPGVSVGQRANSLFEK